MTLVPAGCSECGAPVKQGHRFCEKCRPKAVQWGIVRERPMEKEPEKSKDADTH